MSGILASPAALTTADRCDRCGAAAMVRAVLPTGGELLFCGHHANEHVLVRVVPAEEKFTAGRQDGADHCCGSAAVTTVGGGECSWTGQNSAHCRPPIVGHRRRWRCVTHRSRPRIGVHGSWRGVPSLTKEPSHMSFDTVTPLDRCRKFLPDLLIVPSRSLQPVGIRPWRTTRRVAPLDRDMRHHRPGTLILSGDDTSG